MSSRSKDHDDSSNQSPVSRKSRNTAPNEQRDSQIRYKSEEPIGDEKNDVASQKGSLHVRSQGSIAENAQNMV